jgi:hypothetical protein
MAGILGLHSVEQRIAVGGCLIATRNVLVLRGDFEEALPHRA